MLAAENVHIVDAYANSPVGHMAGVVMETARAKNHLW